MGDTNSVGAHLSRVAVGRVTASGSRVRVLRIGVVHVVGIAALASVVHACFSRSARVRRGAVCSGSSGTHLVAILTVHVILVVVVIGVGVKSSVISERAHALSIRASLARRTFVRGRATSVRVAIAWS